VVKSDVPLLWVVLDSIQDPMNFGAILRSSYFLGVDQLFVVQQNSCSMTPVVSKASSGVMEIMRLYAVADLSAFIQERRADGWEVLGTASSVSDRLTTVQDGKLALMADVAVTKNTVLALGNEGRGLTDDIWGQCDRLVSIAPGRSLHPLVDSLNVSVASGILLHHLCQSRSQKQEN